MWNFFILLFLLHNSFKSSQEADILSEISVFTSVPTYVPIRQSFGINITAVSVVPRHATLLLDFNDGTLLNLDFSLDTNTSYNVDHIYNKTGNYSLLLSDASSNSMPLAIGHIHAVVEMFTLDLISPEINIFNAENAAAVQVRASVKVPFTKIVTIYWKFQGNSTKISEIR